MLLFIDIWGRSAGWLPRNVRLTSGSLLCYKEPMDMRWLHVLLPAVCSAAFIVSWFNTNLSAHVFGLLKSWRVKLPWTEEGLEVEDSTEWFNWLTITVDSKWAELITCPICFSWHVGFWTGALFLAAGHISPIEFVMSVPVGVLLSYIIEKG